MNDELMNQISCFKTFKAFWMILFAYIIEFDDI